MVQQFREFLHDDAELTTTHRSPQPAVGEATYYFVSNNKAPRAPQTKTWQNVEITLMIPHGVLRFFFQDTQKEPLHHHHRGVCANYLLVVLRGIIV